MNIYEGNFLWNKNTGIIKKYEYLSKDMKCDTLVIGGGITGAITAFMQAKTGANVIVVDKNIIGYGMTLKREGIILREMDITETKSKRLSLEITRKYNKLCNNAVEDILNIISEISEDEECKRYIDELGLKEMDMLYYTDKIIRKHYIYRLFEKYGEYKGNVEYLEQDPLFNLRAGLLIPRNGFVLNPYVFACLIYMYLSKKENVKIYENTYIENINFNNEEVECLTSNRFKIRSKCAILTCGMHTLKYIDEFSVDVCKMFNIATERIKNVNKNNINIIAKNTESKSSAVTFTKDNRILLSGESIKVTESIQDKKRSAFLEKGKYKKLYYTLNRVLPFSNPPKIDKCYSLIYAKTKDSLPIIDEIKNIPNVYCNFPSGRNGIVQAMIGANILKDVSKKYYIKDMQLFREDRL